MLWEPGAGKARRDGNLHVTSSQDDMIKQSLKNSYEAFLLLLRKLSDPCTYQVKETPEFLWPYHAQLDTN